jgi:serine/threonine protein kinase
MAPEVLLGRRYDYAADLWSMGALLYALLSGCMPYAQSVYEDSSAEFEAVVGEAWSFGAWHTPATRPRGALSGTHSHAHADRHTLTRTH